MTELRDGAIHGSQPVRRPPRVDIGDKARLSDYARSSLRSVNVSPSISWRYDPSVCGIAAAHRVIRRFLGADGVSRPNTATPFVVPTYTRPFTIVGVMNLFPAPNASRLLAA
jgi:hypothetical protein